MSVAESPMSNTVGNGLQSGLQNINLQAKLMKQNLDDNNLLQALKFCSNFLNELRTNQLSPKQYYELYIVVFDNLDILSTYLMNHYHSQLKKLQKSQNNTNTSPLLADLYELVQYSGNIIPRLYMMIVIGTTYMATENSPTKEIMKDLIEMCKGVQHPIRGLFLRYYLSQRTKDLLPIGNEIDFKGTVDFLVTNFIEMNKLWVRLQHQGHSSERETRYKERKEIKILVGSNLVKLSQIIDDFEGEFDDFSSLSYYQSNIFPIITEQIIQCRDHLAQTYLIDVLIQVFPDEFHFATLDSLLNKVFINLHPLLSKSELISTLIDRFVKYHESIEHDKLESTISNLSLQDNSSDEKFDTKKLFDVFWSFYIKNYEMDPELPHDEHSSILQSMIRLSLTFDVNNYQNLDKIFKFASEELPNNTDTQELSLKLLAVPINHFKSIHTLFKLSFFHEFYSKLTNVQYQKDISLKIVDKLLNQESREYLTSAEEIDGVFQYLLVLIKDSEKDLTTSKNLGLQKTVTINEKVVTQKFLDNQEKLSKIIHLVENPKDPLKNLNNLMYVRRKYLNKGTDNIVHTYPTLVSKILHKLKIAGYVVQKSKKSDSNQELLLTSNFKNLSVIIDELYRYHQETKSELVLQMYLNAASIADQLKEESISYELFSQCFVVYEENLITGHGNYYQRVNPHDSVGGSSIPYQSIIAIANELNTSRNFTKENYESLITKLTLYGSKLLKKQEQCRAVYFCSHLWWWTEELLEPGEKSPTVQVQKKEVQEKPKEKNVETTAAESDSTTDEKEKHDAEEKEEEEVVEGEDAEQLYRDPKRVLECLQKALRIADSCMDPYLSLKLFIEIFNRCLIFHIYGNYLVDAKYINGLIELIKTNIDNLKESDEQISNNESDKEAVLFKISRRIFDRTLSYIANQQQLDHRFDESIIV